MARGVYTGLLSDATRVDYLFCVSLKAVIRNKEGKILVTNEAGRSWHLPGGGMEHGEDIASGLKRELDEEVGYNGSIDYCIIGAEPMYIGEELDIWQMWIVLDVVVESFDFMDDRSRLIDINELAALPSSDSRLTYKFAQMETRISKGL